ncbi:hypothetical protein [Frankia sp. CiP3]|uniref:hypothetical protein n=1 Tax=Frankia sp. CiP3 TaxID=2880971 RepID=UPI001EF53FD6|nr:hypothetical protein [Frankia sp. CiP3]
MVDSLGLSVAALLAARGAEAFGAGAGHGAWEIISRLADVVRRRFSGDAQAAGAIRELAANPTSSERIQTVAEFVSQYARLDPEFTTTLKKLLSDGQSEPLIRQVVTNVSDSASVEKIVNIGEVHGGITF